MKSSRSFLKGELRGKTFLGYMFFLRRKLATLKMQCYFGVLTNLRRFVKFSKLVKQIPSMVIMMKISNAVKGYL